MKYFQLVLTLITAMVIELLEQKIGVGEKDMIEKELVTHKQKFGEILIIPIAMFSNDNGRQRKRSRREISGSHYYSSNRYRTIYE